MRYVKGPFVFWNNTFNHLNTTLLYRPSLPFQKLPIERKANEKMLIGETLECSSMLDGCCKFRFCDVPKAYLSFLTTFDLIKFDVSSTFPPVSKSLASPTFRCKPLFCGYIFLCLLQRPLILFCWTIGIISYEFESNTESFK